MQMTAHAFSAACTDFVIIFQSPLHSYIYEAQDVSCNMFDNDILAVFIQHSHLFGKHCFGFFRKNKGLVIL